MNLNVHMISRSCGLGGMNFTKAHGKPGLIIATSWRGAF